MKPLEDIRVIAIEQYGAGPFGSLHLADLGAEVIKIEDPGSGGDMGRYIPPFQEGEDSLFFETFNRNKKSLSLCLTVPEGRRVFEDLVAGSDVVYSNLRGDVPAKLGLRYADLSEVNPRIVCVSVSGFGMTGPMSKEPAFDYILQGLAGWMELTGEPNGPPTRAGLSLVDYCGGYVAAIALLAGVHAARRDGKGMDCDISLYDVAVSLLTYPATWHLSRGWEPVRQARSAHPSLVPFQLFKGNDGVWFMVGCAKQSFFYRVAEVAGRPDLAEHPDYDTPSARYDNREALIEILDALFSGHPAGYWIDRLKEAGVPVGPIQGIPEAVTHSHTAARELIVETSHEVFGTVRSLASPVRVGDPGDITYRRSPKRNEHADEILRSRLGYDDALISRLREGGAFGTAEDTVDRPPAVSGGSADGPSSAP